MTSQGLGAHPPPAENPFQNRLQVRKTGHCHVRMEFWRGTTVGENSSNSERFCTALPRQVSESKGRLLGARVFACPAANARLREAMILRTAVRLNCIYAVHASTRIALNSGLSKTEVEALTADGPVAGIDLGFRQLLPQRLGQSDDA